jgi:hypothetical protein
MYQHPNKQNNKQTNEKYTNIVQPCGTSNTKIVLEIFGSHLENLNS